MKKPTCITARRFLWLVVSEHLVFTDAWLCWCFAELDIPALEVHFIAGIDVDKHANSNRTVNIMDDPNPDGSLFWDSCCSCLLIDYMVFPVSVPSYASLQANAQD